MASPYLPESSVFKQLNFIDLVAFNIATAIWGANTCNSALFAFAQIITFSQDKASGALWTPDLTFFAMTENLKRLVSREQVAWVWVVTTVSQGLATTEGGSISSGSTWNIAELTVTGAGNVVKFNYVLWGFISSDSTIRSNPLTNVINLMACLVAASSQAFFIYEIWMNSRKLHLIPIFAAPPIIFQIVVSLSSIVAPLSSLWDFYRKDLVLTSLFVDAILNACIFAGLSRIFGPRYFSLMARKENSIPFIPRVLLFSVDTGFWLVIVCLSNVTMFYFLYSYSSLFILYSHLTTSVYFLTILSFLGSTPYVDDTNSVINAHFTSSAARARMVSLRRANARSMVVDGEDIYFKHTVSDNHMSQHGHHAVGS